MYIHVLVHFLTTPSPPLPPLPSFPPLPPSLPPLSPFPLSLPSHSGCRIRRAKGGPRGGGNPVHRREREGETGLLPQEAVGVPGRGRGGDGEGIPPTTREAR